MDFEPHGVGPGRICPDCGNPLPAAEGVGCPGCLFGLASVGGPEDVSGRVTARRGPLPGLRSRSFGQYEIVDEIARGGMGVVYRARQRGLDRCVALKMLPPGHIPSPSAWERFRTEIAAAARLHHPGIVPLYESGEVDGVHYYTMRLMEGGDLARQLARWREGRDGGGGAGGGEGARGGAATRRARVDLVIQVARAVHHAHQRGVLHRDLKPSNILLDESGAPVVGDFGLAKLLARENAATLTESILGSPNYMAPEQAEGRGADLTVETDVYGLGAILYECLTGVPPFRAATPLETIRKVTEEAVARPRLADPGLDIDLETICLKCLEKEPRARYRSAEELADDLERWRDGHPVLARKASLAGRLGRWARRRPALAALSGVVGLLVGIGVLGGWLAAARVRSAEREARANLREALLGQARVVNRSGILGGRGESLEALRRAGILGGDGAFRARLRDEAMVALGLSDVRFSAGARLTGNRPEWSLVDLPRERVAQVVAPSEISLKRLGDGVEIRRIGVDGAPIERLESFSADGRCLAVRRVDGLTFCDAETGATLFATNVSNRAFCFAPASARVLLEESEGEPRVATVRELPSFDVVHRMEVPGVAGDERLQGWGLFSWAPGEKMLATARHGGTVVECFDVATGRVLWRRQDPVRTMAFAWDVPRRRILLGAADGQCWLMRWTDGTVEGRLEFPGGPRSLAFSHDGSVLAVACDDRRVRLMDTASRRLLYEMPSDTHRVEFDGGLRVGTLVRAGEVGWLEMTRSRIFREAVLPSPTNAWTTLGFLPDGRGLMLAGRGRLVWWDPDGAWTLGETRLAGGRFFAEADPGGDGIWTCESAGVVRRTLSRKGTRRLEAGRERVVLPGRQWSALAFGAGRERLWVANLSSNAVLGFTREAEFTGEVLGPHPGVDAVAASADGRWVASGSSRSKDVTVWDVRARRAVATLHAGRNHRLAFSPDSQWLVVHGEIFALRRAGEWETEPRLSFPEEPGTLGAAAFSPDGRRLAVVENQYDIRLFELASGANLGRLATPELTSVLGLDFHPDGRRLSVLGSRGRWRMWDLAGVERELGALGLALHRP